MLVNKKLKLLLTSRTRLGLLGIFFKEPGEMYFVRELVRISKEEINSVRRELANLLKIGVIESEPRGNKIYYWTNFDSIFYRDLLVLMNKTTGLGAKIIKRQNRLGKLKYLIYSNSFANGKRSPIGSVDLVVVGKVNLGLLDSYIKDEEKDRKQEINYMLMDRKEFKMRILRRDPFLVDFFLNLPVVIIGNIRNISGKI